MSYIKLGTGSGSLIQVALAGGSVADLQKQFDEVVQKLRPAPNRIQRALYGDDRLNAMSDDELRKIVEEKRGMGNTTVQALKQIVDALQNPGRAVQLQRDHPHDNHAANRDYIEQHILPTIEALGLKFLVVDKLKQTLKFDV